MKAVRLVMLVMLAAGFRGLYGQSVRSPREDWSKGPLIGRNWYLPFAIYYHYPGYRASPGDRSDFEYRVAQYYTNDYYSIFSSVYQNSLTRGQPEAYPSGIYVSRDYESFNLELGCSFRPLRRLALGIDLRLVSYFGGFLDSSIELLHGIFDLPNGFRELSSRGRVLVDMQNSSGVTLSLDHGALSFGDVDLHARYTFLETASMALAGYSAFKVPTGRPGLLSGSGHPDAALGLVADFMPLRFFSWYAHAGLTVPFDALTAGSGSRPKPFFVGMAGIELTPARRLSLHLQLNIKSPTLEPSIEDDLHWIFTESNMLLLPQTNLLAGFSLGAGDSLWQFYLEENTFTSAGADITFNLAWSRTVPRR